MEELDATITKEGKSQWDKETEEGEEPQRAIHSPPVCCLAQDISHEWKEIVSSKKQQQILKRMSSNEGLGLRAKERKRQKRQRIKKVQ